MPHGFLTFACVKATENSQTSARPQQPSAMTSNGRLTSIQEIEPQKSSIFQNDNSFVATVWRSNNMVVTNRLFLD